ncbi:MAG: UDP-N-acetylmuramate--L-alanine ligase [Bacteroidetes bacterium]|nr:UDP-N-acetylmuramate--L-alanine ligase [Bacteroidota bacterium]
MKSQRRQPWFGQIRHVHMVGIGGIGMSSIASVLLAREYRVTGSDLSLSELTDKLETQGAVIYEGHDEKQVSGADVVVYSSAVDVNQNPETQAAIAQRIPLIPRAEMLGELMRMKYGVGVSGTHGKTTATSMVGYVVAEGGFDPTIIVGGKVTELNSNAVSGEGDIIVIEADEYDRTFLRLTPALAVITTIEADHLEIYGDIEEVYRAFTAFAASVPFFGAAIVCLDDPGVQAIIGRIDRRVVTYGTARQAMVRAERIQQQGQTTHFDVFASGNLLGSIHLRALGLHNVRNALAAITVGMELDIDFVRIKSGLELFAGVQRRFQVLGEGHDILVIDDYAHHPTEVVATLAAASEGYPDRRIVGIFQPHLYSRTNDFKDEFARSFFNADVMIVTEIYPAREAPVPGVTGELLVELAITRGHRDVRYIKRKETVLTALQEICMPGDVVLFMGAGDIWRTAHKYTEQLCQSAAA